MNYLDKQGHNDMLDNGYTYKNELIRDTQKQPNYLRYNVLIRWKA